MIPWVVIDRRYLRQSRHSCASSSSTFQPANLQTFQHLVFRTFFQVPYPATPLFATLTKTAGVCTNNSHSGTTSLRAKSRSTLRRPDLQTFQRASDLSPFLQTRAHSFALFCTIEKLNLLVFKCFRTLCQKITGGGGGGRVSAHLNWLSFTSSDKIASPPAPRAQTHPAR